MTRQFELYIVDAFTRVPFRGNPAGVVPDARGLSATEMQAIARELGVPETAFVSPPDGADHDLRIRFFTPKMEVSIGGHATVAAHHLLWELGREKAGGEGTHIVQRTPAGRHFVQLVEADGAVKVIMSHPIPEFSRLPAEIPQPTVLEILGLEASDLAEGLPVSAAYAGDFTILVPVRDRIIVDALSPDARTLSKAFASYFVFALEEDRPGLRSHTRMFAPAFGILEDPATGMAHGALGAYLVMNGLGGEGDAPLRLFSRQGEALGRTGEIEVLVEHSDTAVMGVKVAGQAVTVFRAKFALE